MKKRFWTMLLIVVLLVTGCGVTAKPNAEASQSEQAGSMVTEVTRLDDAKYNTEYPVEIKDIKVDRNEEGILAGSFLVENKGDKELSIGKVAEFEVSKDGKTWEKADIQGAFAVTHEANVYAPGGIATLKWEYKEAFLPERPVMLRVRQDVIVVVRSEDIADYENTIVFYTTVDIKK